MGADARLFLFDYSVFRDTVAPAFTEFIRTGRASAWLLDINRQYVDHTRADEDPYPGLKLLAPTDMRAHCTYLDAQFGTIHPVPFRDLYGCDWEVRGCKLRTCAVHEQCPFFARSSMSPMTGDVQELLMVLHFAIVRCCIGQGQFLGRSVDAFFYDSTLDELGVSKDDPIRPLLELLGRRGFVVGYRWTMGTEGIHGWLRPDEASKLSDRLFALDLPEYERSFSAMERLKSARNLVEGLGLGWEFNTLVHSMPGVPFDHLSLSLVRTVCSIASKEGKGVLWGNDFA